MTRINPTSEKQRTTLRRLGGILLLLGIALFVFGISEGNREFEDFGKNADKRMQEFRKNPGGHSFHSNNEPEETYYEWVTPIGGLMAMAGLICLAMGYMGAISRYQAGEIAPVAKDTLNYLGKEGKEGMTAIGDALFSGINPDDPPKSAKERLEELESLRKKGLITEIEYQEKRDHIIDDI